MFCNTGILLSEVCTLNLKGENNHKNLRLANMLSRLGSNFSNAHLQTNAETKSQWQTTLVKPNLRWKPHANE